MNTFDVDKSDVSNASPFFFFYRWIVIAPMVAFSTLVFGSIIIVFCLFGLPKFASRVFGRMWARLNMAVSFMKRNIVGAEKLDPNQSYVVVANHQSLVDIYVLYGHLNMDFKWVMKKELRAVPVLGMACEMMGHILVDRSNTELALKSINGAREHIKDGVCVVFFAEGTRSRDGELKPFKKGAFRLALELGLPILPVTIHNTRLILPSDTTEIVPGTVTMEYSDPIPTAGMTVDDVDVLSSQTRDVIAHALEERVS